MSRKKKTILILFSIYLLLTLLRETGFVTINWYNSEIKTNTIFDWSQNDIKTTPLDPESTANERYVDIPIIITYDGDTLYKDKSEYTALYVKIRKMPPDFLWTPLIKHSDLSVSAVCSYDGELMIGAKTDERTYTKLEGSFSLKGNVTIFGICSHRTALQIVKEFVANDIKRQVIKKLKSMDRAALQRKF